MDDGIDRYLRISRYAERVQAPIPINEAGHFQFRPVPTGLDRGAVFCDDLSIHAKDEDVKVVQELLRRGSARITIDVYAQAITAAKRTSQGKLVAMLRNGHKKAA